MTFTVTCRSGFGAGSCDLPTPATVQVSFAYSVASFCAELVEVASVDAELVTDASDYVVGTLLSGQAVLRLEGGVVPSLVETRRLEIASGGGGAAVVVAVEDGAATGSVPTVAFPPQSDGQAVANFSFLLDEDAISFAGASTTAVVLTAEVRVTYEEPSGQRVVTVKAAAAGSLGTAASATVQVTGQPRQQQSTSTSSSVVLGVSTGVAVAAAAGLVAVAVAAAAGAAAWRRGKRRALAPPRAVNTRRGDTEMQVAPAPAAVNTRDLKVVADIYDL